MEEGLRDTKRGTSVKVRRTPPMKAGEIAEKVFGRPRQPYQRITLRLNDPVLIESPDGTPLAILERDYLPGWGTIENLVIFVPKRMYPHVETWCRNMIRIMARPLHTLTEIVAEYI